MNITYNNLGVGEATNLVTFTDIPNILKVEDNDSGSYARLTIKFKGNLNSVTSKNGEFYITFLGESITNVTNPAESVNKYFYIGSVNSTTAAYAARAFRNCSTIAASFKVENTGDTVVITARAVGKVWTGMSNYFQTNIPSDYIQVSATDGSSDASLFGAKVDVDVYSEDASGVKYITTLEKNYYGSECAFDMSPVLTTFAEIGKTMPYTMKVSSLKGDTYSVLAQFNDNYIAQGYMCNQGNKYINLGDSTLMFAQNFSRGSNKDKDNNTLLYVYGTTIPFSFITHNNGGMNITIDYRDSDLTLLESYSGYTWRNTDSSRKLWDYTVDLAFNTGMKERFKQAFYIDVTLGSIRTARYNVIKPLKATEYYQRILWRNSYGGISFFDFTGQKTETRDFELATYQKSIYDYYTDPRNELDKVYDNKVKYNVTLKSHLFEEDGKYVFNDLIQSPEVWTVINGQEYAIILDSVNVEETDRNNIYEATVKYHYSQEPSII